MAAFGVLGTSKKSKTRATGYVSGGAGTVATTVSIPHVDPQTRNAPDDTWTKTEIVAWLMDRGIEMSESALMKLTKAELLALVADYLDEETDP